MDRMRAKNYFFSSLPAKKFSGRLSGNRFVPAVHISFMTENRRFLLDAGALQNLFDRSG
jgi:hypothetical protein